MCTPERFLPILEDKAIEKNGHRMSEESHPFVESAKTANPLAKAEGWLSSVADHVDTVWDQEALVYLRSRGRDCHDRVTALIQSWKAAEQARLDQYNQTSKKKGKKKGKKREPEANITNVAEISPIFLRDFWGAAPLGEYSSEATMLRTVGWCEIAGFEQWWRRLAQRRKEMLFQGGMEEPAAAAYWLFNMVRSDYAIQLMPRVLDGYLESISLAGLNKRQPWVFDCSRGPALEQHLAYASAIVFAHHRLLSDNVHPELVHQAVETICRHQDGNGAWRSLTGDADVSIESTAMALHALAVAQPAGWARMAALARDWLWSMQKDDGSWIETGASGPVHLTVLALDAIALANENEKVTFRWRPASQATPRQDGLGQRDAEPGWYTEELASESSCTVADGAVNADTTSEPSATDLEAPVGTTSVAQQRRAAVDVFIKEASDKLKRRFTRKEIWRAAGYTDPTEFERWQRDDPRTSAAAKKVFTRILTKKPPLK